MKSEIEMDNLPSSSPNAIAIIGMACRFPGAESLEGFWESLVAGVESITFFSAQELRAAGVEAELLADPSYVGARAVIAGAELFDAGLFGFTPREAEVIDPQHRLLLERAWEALEHAGYDPRRFPGPIGVFAGAGINTYLLSNLQHNPEVIGTVGSFQAMVGSSGDFLATRISYKLGLRGPSLTVQTACSTSLVAVHLAVQSLLNGECDMALAGGVRLLVPRKGGYLHQAGGILSRDGHCRAFDAAATGTIDGEGCGLVVLKRLSDALAGGDHIHAVILGSAINNDGSAKMSYTVPSIEGQAEVIALAQALAGIDAASIGLIEAHGTGTPLGDPIEVAALARVFATAAEPGLPCALVSLKSNMGHLDAAAGIASLIKAALAVEHGVIPPSLHFERPNPQLGLESSPFYVPVEAAPWPGEGPRRAGVSSFGIGGTNAHVVLEQAPEVPPGTEPRPRQLVVLSARTQAALEQVTQNLAGHLRRHPEVDFADVAYTLQMGRAELDHRRIVVCADTADAAEVLGALDPKRVLARTREAGDRAVFFLFPGQGSQHPGMGAELYRTEPAFREEVDCCAEILRPLLGLDLRQALYAEGEDPERAAERLRQTGLAQPALFVVEYALARLWLSWGVRPQAMLGHSVGEYVAACLAGVFSLEDALRLVAERGRLMQEMPGGSMLAVALPEAEVPLADGLSLAAVNGPAMCVVSGESSAVEDLAVGLEERGVQVRRLHTSHAFHSAAMDPVLARFAAAFTGLRLRAPAIPFLSNLTGAWIRPEEATAPGYWVRHLRGTVRFSDGLEALFARPSPVFLEVGPGQALTALVRQHPRRPATPSVLASLPPAGDGKPADAALLRTLGQLWLAGVEIDWAGFHARERRLRVPLPTYPFERRRYWVEPAAGEQRRHLRAVGAQGDVAGWLWAPLWHQSLPPVGSGTAEGSWLLLAGGDGFGDRLAARLRERGAEVTVAHTGEAADYGDLLDRLAERGTVPDRIVHLGCAGAVQDAEREQEMGFYSLLRLARALGERRPAGARPPLHVGIVSTGVWRITGAEELVPVRATLLGPATVLPQEYPGITCAAIDVTLPPPGSRQEDRLLDLLLAELTAAADPIVAYRGTDRWLRVFEPLRLESPPGPLPLQEGGTWLITGGLGGVGLELAGLLARLAKAKLVLTGRSPFPDREAWPALARGEGHAARTAGRLLALEEAGAEVWPVAADVTDAAAIRRVLGEVRRRFGRIDGVVHAAGVAGGGLMQLRSPAAAAAVLAPKVQGTLLLAELLAEDPPDLLVLCSSLNALTGGPGQIDYTAANAFLDAFAQSCSEDLPVISINWDAWRGVGMAARLHRAEADLSPEVMALEPFPHPLLRERGIDGDGSEVFVGHLSPGETWILDEHRLGGHPVVPGTAYLEMAGAAFRWMAAPNGAVEIRDVQFVTPLHVADGETRELRIVLRPDGDGFHRFSARSRDGGGWQEHVQGEVGAAAGEERVRIDLSSLAGWEEEILGESYREDLKQAGLGPRWEVLKKVYRRDGEFIGLLELAPELAGDVEGFQLHPALLDAATSFAEYYVPGARSNYYLPFSYKRLRMMGPLPSRIYSHVRLHDPDHQGVETLAFDVAIFDETGFERVRVEELTLKRVDVSATLRDHARRWSASSPALPLREMPGGMEPEQAVEAFRRILVGGRVPQIAVSVRPLPEVLEQSRSMTVEHVVQALGLKPGGHTRPDLETEYVAPRGELEERLAAIWSDLLGLDRVGAADDFFELGGHSLLGTQLMSRVREAFHVEVPLGRLFEAATVAELAAVVGAQLAAAGAMEHDRIPRLPRGSELPLSFAQERLWFLALLDPDSPAYNLPSAVRMTGRLDVPALVASLREIVRRHEALRTRFAEVEGRPVQIVEPHGQPEITLVDLGGLPEGRREAVLRGLMAAQSARPFDLARGPLLRMTLICLGGEEHTALSVAHHVVMDGWSFGIFLHELEALYAARIAGRPALLPELPVQYADYAVWQRGWLSGEILERKLAFWRQYLADAPTVLDLADRPRPARKGFRAGTCAFQIPAGVTADFAAVGRRSDATLFMTLLAAFETLLSRYTGQEDLVVGTTVANRDRPEIEGLIGMFVNTLAVRADLAGDPTFPELLERVRRRLLEIYANQDLPFERVVDDLGLPRSLSHAPLLQVLLVLRSFPAVERVPLEGLAFDPLAVEVAGAQFDLTLAVSGGEDDLLCLLEYDRDLFDPAAVQRLERHFGELVRGIASDPGRRLSDLPLLTAAERHQLAEWSHGPEVPPGPLAHRAFEARAARAPDAIALSFEGEPLSYRALDERANRLARYLRRLRIEPGALVGLRLDRTPDLVVALLAVWKAGGAWLPLEPSHPEERLSALLADARPALVLTPAWLDAARDRIDRESGSALEDGADLGDPAYVLYTSGSTGAPKGVIVPHRGLSNYLSWAVAAYEVDAGLTAPVFTSIAFDLTITSLIAPLLGGGTLLLLPEASALDDLRDLLRGGTGRLLLKLTPSHLTWLQGSLADVRMPGLTGAMIVGGEALLPSTAAWWREHAPGLRLVNEYGPTETVVGCCVHEVSGPAAGSVPIGRPISGARLYLLDRWLGPVPPGTVGELFVGGEGVASGYLGRAALTAERFLPDLLPARPGARMYRTGDLARHRPGGELEFLGRCDNQVKVRGFRIEPGEIEAVLSRFPGVREAAVVPWDTAGGGKLAAYVGCGLDTAPTPEELRSFLKTELPDYMIPSAFVPLAALPRNANGKLDRSSLPAPRPGPAAEGRVPPRTPLEEVLAGLMAEVLRLDEVGVFDSFFDLGGHSLLAVEMLSLVRETFGVEIAVARVFETPTVAGLAAYLLAEPDLRQRVEAVLPVLLEMAGEAVGERT